MLNRTRFCVILALLSLLAFMPSSGRSQNSPDDMQGPQQKPGVVYVCACLKTKSCSCMTESKMEGPCACGVKGGPPLKEVPSNSAWAKTNRKELSR